MTKRDIENRTFTFACDIALLCVFLMTRGPVVRRLSYQLLDAGTSVGSIAEEAAGAQNPGGFRLEVRDRQEGGPGKPLLDKDRQVQRPQTLRKLHFVDRSIDDSVDHSVGHSVNHSVDHSVVIP